MNILRKLWAEVRQYLNNKYFQAALVVGIVGIVLNSMIKKAIPA
jgi:hypothetical protein